MRFAGACVVRLMLMTILVHRHDVVTAGSMIVLHMHFLRGTMLVHDRVHVRSAHTFVAIRLIMLHHASSR